MCIYILIKIIYLNNNNEYNIKHYSMFDMYKG